MRHRITGSKRGAFSPLDLCLDRAEDVAARIYRDSLVLTSPDRYTCVKHSQLWSCDCSPSLSVTFWF